MDDSPGEGGHGNGSLREASGISSRALRLDGVRVLLVEDSPDNQRLFQRILSSAGASVDLACNGLEAIHLQAENQYEVIVMDIRMPVVDGYQATRQIRANGYAKRIIALTAHATPGEEERCRASGCSDFLLKPIDRMGLLRAVEAATRKSEQETSINTAD